MSNLISRQAAIDAMKQSVCGDTWEVDKAIEAVERVPSAQPEPHEGHWINAKLECGKSDHQHITTARTAAQRWI